MLTPCTCLKSGVKYSPSEFARIHSLPVTPTTVSAIADRVPTHGTVLNGRRYLSNCPHNRAVFTGEAKRTVKHNPVYVDPSQVVFA